MYDGVVMPQLEIMVTAFYGCVFPFFWFMKGKCLCNKVP